MSLKRKVIINEQPQIQYIDAIDQQIEGNYEDYQTKSTRENQDLQPKSILKKTGVVGQVKNEQAGRTLQVSQSTGALEAKKNKSAISNIKQRIQQAIVDNKNSSQKIRADGVNDLVNIAPLESKQYEEAQLQKYQQRDEDKTDKKVVMLDQYRVNLQPKKARAEEGLDTRKKEQLGRVQLPKIQIKSKKDLQINTVQKTQKTVRIEEPAQSQQQYIESQQIYDDDEDYKTDFNKNISRQRYEDDELRQLQQHQLYVNPPAPKTESQVVVVSKPATPVEIPKTKGSVILQHEGIQSPQKQKISFAVDDRTEEREANKEQKKVQAQRPAFLKILSTIQTPTVASAQAQSTMQSSQQDNDKEIERLEQEIKEKKSEVKLSNIEFDKLPLSRRKGYADPNLSISVKPEEDRKKFKKHQEHVFKTVDNNFDIVSNFMTLFTTEAFKQAQIDKHQKELLLKTKEDEPLFSNVRESIKSFTDILNNQSAVMSGVIKRRNAAMLNQKSSRSMPKLKSLALLQKHDFKKLDGLFGFENRYHSLQKATETAPLDKEELLKLKRQNQNLLKEEQTDEVKICINEFLLNKYNFKHGWIEQLDLSGFLFSRFASFCDLSNGQVCMSGGLDQGDEVSDTALLFDTRTKEVDQLDKMAIARYRHQLIESHGSIFAIGGLNRLKLAVRQVEAFDIKLSREWRRCESMHFERSEFCAVSAKHSHFIYVFGGTLNQQENQLIEKYNCRDDHWEVLTVKITCSIDMFNTHCLLVQSDQILLRSPNMKQKLEKAGDFFLSREEMLIRQMLDINENEQALSDPQIMIQNKETQDPDETVKEELRVDTSDIFSVSTKADEFSEIKNFGRSGKADKGKKLKMNVRLTKAKANEEKRLLEQANKIILQTPKANQLQMLDQDPLLQMKENIEKIKSNGVLPDEQSHQQEQEEIQHCGDILLICNYKNQQLFINKFDIGAGETTTLQPIQLSFKDSVSAIHLNRVTNKFCLLRKHIASSIEFVDAQSFLTETAVFQSKSDYLAQFVDRDVDPEQYKEQLRTAKSTVAVKQAQRSGPFIPEQFNNHIQLEQEIMQRDSGVIQTPVKLVNPLTPSTVQHQQFQQAEEEQGKQQRKKATSKDKKAKQKTSRSRSKQQA